MCAYDLPKEMLKQGHVYRCMGQTYTDSLSLYSEMMSRDKYNIDVRPILNQSHILNVGVSFELLAIVELDDVSQSFNCNGLVAFFWTDQILVWDPNSYGGKTLIHPQAEKIWRPKVVLGNTIDKQDIFAKDNAPVLMFYNGSTSWFPGSTFPTTCALNMTKYPFDEQFCRIYLLSMSHPVDEVQFVPLTNEVGTQFYIKNGVWELYNTHINVLNVTYKHTGIMVSCIAITFHLRRNPAGILINILLPVMFLSFLNLWVFVIPVESGEKIGYGTTVLMALSVFLTTMSGMLPVSSEELPKVVVYIFILLIISLLTVITSIIIVFLYHKEEKEANHLLAQANLTLCKRKATLTRKAVSAIDNRSSYEKNDKKVCPLTSAEEGCDLRVSFASGAQTRCVKRHNRYKTIGKYIDLISLIIFFAAWLGITLVFLLEVSH